MFKCVFVSGGNLDMLSVFRQFLVEFDVVKIPNNNDERVQVFFLCVGYLVGL